MIHIQFHLTYDLYILIFYTQGLTEVVRMSLQKSRTSNSISIIITILNLVLTLNDFVFHIANYLQKKGCAIGTKYTPSYETYLGVSLNKI